MVFSLIIFDKRTKYLLLEIDLVLNLFFYKKGFEFIQLRLNQFKIIKKFEVNFDELIKYIAEGKYFDTIKLSLKILKFSLVII